MAHTGLQEVPLAADIPMKVPMKGYDNPSYQNDKEHTKKCKSKKYKNREEHDNIKESTKMVGFMELFSFADGFDIFLMSVGLICALLHGIALPLVLLIVGNVTNVFVKNSIANSTEVTTTNISECKHPPGFNLEAEITKYSLYYAAVAAGTLLTGFFQVWTFFLAATRQTARIRRKFFYAILHQEMSWFDTAQIGTLNTRLTEDINTIRDGLGDKVSMFAQYLSTFVSGVIIAFVHGWKLTLVVLSVCPLLATSAAVWSKILASLAAKEMMVNSKAGAIAEEILSAIRTVVAFNGQKKAAARYEFNLQDAKNAGMKKSFTTNLALGISQFLTFSTYALGFWYGAKLTVDEKNNYNIGNILTICFSVILGTFHLGQTAPNLESVACSRVAAYEVFKVIKKHRLIDSSSNEGHKPDKLIGNIEFRNVHFSYPTRPDSHILKGLSMKIETGKTVALVGASGCGKSTTIQLLQRFYDPLQGEITLDGHDVQTLNVKWLRQNIGVVSQEPILFGTTIEENIRYGREDVADHEIEHAAKEANAYEFICNLPEKFETVVGQRGAQLSGGQKQRIAIARALVRNPKILLLDEATSALDTESESIVQAALEKAREGRTTILIAHRLSTVRTADVIAGFENGVVVEQGSHSELMEKKGVYYSLVMKQSQPNDEEDAREDESSEGTEDETDDEIGDFYESVPEVTANENRRGSVFSTLSQVTLKSSTKEIKSKKKSKHIAKGIEELPDVPFTKVLLWSKPEWLYLFMAVLASAIAGGIWPTFSVLFGKIIGAFKEIDAKKRQTTTHLFSLMFFILGVISIALYIIIGYTLGKAGENLTIRLRSWSFEALLRQEIGWFDDRRNAVGILITRLATDSSQAKAFAGIRLAIFTLVGCSLLTVVLISFAYCWQLSLLILACLPFLVCGHASRSKVMAGHAAVDQSALEEAGRISTEAVENIRTVAALSKEDAFYEQYSASLQKPYRDALKGGPVNGIVYGLVSSLQFFVNAAFLRLGAWLIAHCYTDFESVFIVFYCTLFTAKALGQSTSVAPDFSKAKLSVQRIAKLLNRQPLIDSYSEDGKVPDKFVGEIEFREARFAYPTRPKVQVLRGLTLRVAKGQTLALVGSSGCGKSTTVQLLERFYDPFQGCVLADGIATKSLNLHWLRSQLGIVSQEPTLFDCSIAENIQYGDNSRIVSQEEIEDAAKAANIHSFIENLPEKYKTRVGDKGAQLSGGQKQRIAIARALVRKPKVLLLDEATSALDTESEKIVQSALDNARLGRTCIVIAHRLSTVKNADIIAVMHQGRVVEQGTHNQLIAKQGFYYNLVNAQVSH